MLGDIFENHLIDSLAARFCRAPYQQNLIHESDSEILTMPGNSGANIAVTIDSISEEIRTGLYDDPYLIGWMLVMVNFSDIAAAGAEPIGILISEIFPDDLPSGYIDKIQSGINDAVNKCGSFILGGDTNSGEQLILTGCALGRSPDNKYLTRKGCKAGDILYATNKAGRGNAYAVTKLMGNGSSGIQYYPSARLKEAAVIRKFASCCMDSSDGFLSVMDQLMRVNNCGFTLDDNWKDIIDKEAAETARTHNLPEWLLLAGQHGEFELLFTIPPDNENEFLSYARMISWDPVRLGTATEKPEILLNLYNKTQRLDTKKLRDLPFNTKGDIKKYLQALLQYDSELR